MSATASCKTVLEYGSAECFTAVMILRFYQGQDSHAFLERFKRCSRVSIHEVNKTLLSLPFFTHGKQFSCHMTKIKRTNEAVSFNLAPNLFTVFL